MYVRLLTLIVCAILTAGCSTLSLPNSGGDDATAEKSEEAEEADDKKPYSDGGAPGEAGVNSELETAALDWAQKQDTGAFDSSVDYRWVTMRSDWVVTRDDYGDIKSKEAQIWVGGPVDKAGEYGDAVPGDCSYRMVMATQPYEGGDQYGQTRMYWKKMRTYYKLHCEDAEQLAQATPEGQEAGALPEFSAEEAGDGEAEDAAETSEQEASE